MNEAKLAASILAQVRRAVVGKDEVLARVLAPWSTMGCSRVAPTRRTM